MRILLSLLLALSVASCGFHLRGQTKLPFASIALTGDDGSPFRAALRRAIEAGGSTRVVETAPEYRLGILEESREKVILSLNAAGRVREFELRYHVAFRLTDSKANEIIAPYRFTLIRNMSYDDTQVLAKESEEALLYQDMRDDAVQQILRRLAAAKPAETAESGDQ